FVIDSADAAAAVNLMMTNADFAQWRCASSCSTPGCTTAPCPNGRSVDIHQVEAAFNVNQARPLTGVPPKVAILNVGGASFAVMQGYAVAAGFAWPCTRSGDCAGGFADPACASATCGA